MKIFLAIFLSINLYGSIKQDILNLYQNQKYVDACNLGFNNLARYNRDEEYLSIYAFACLKADYIDRLAIPIAKLKYSPDARSNSAYLSVILMQKKLLYHALLDDYDLSEFNLPTTEHVLSKVFERYAKLGKHEKRALYIFDDIGNDKISYKLYLEKDNKIPKMVIEEYYDNMFVKRHIYW